MSEHLFTDKAAKELMVKWGVIDEDQKDKIHPENVKAIQDRAALYADRGMDFGSAFSRACDDYIKAILKLRETGQESGFM